jgi:hypothetical protein
VDAGEGTDNAVQFDVSPDGSVDSDGDGNVTVDVAANLSVRFGSVGGTNFGGSIDAKAEDSSYGAIRFQPAADLTVEFVPTPGTYVSAEVRDTDGNPISTANTGLGVQFQNLSPKRPRLVENATGGVEFTLNDRGETVRVPIKAGDSYTAEVKVLNESKASPLGLDEVGSSSTNEIIQEGETLELDVTVKRQRVAGRITVSPKDDSAFVGGNNTFTATVFDRNDSRLRNASVRVTSDNDAVDLDASTAANDDSVDGTTDADGEVPFTVTADEVVAEATLTFSVVGTNLSTTATKSFVQSGEGSIQGSVINDASTNPVGGASVWAVLDSQYNQNSRNTTLDVSGDEDGIVFVRLVDNETQSIIDNDDYDVRAIEVNESDDLDDVIDDEDTAYGTAVRKLEEFNVTNESVGEGFAVIDTDGDDEVSFSHTRLEGREYFAEISFTADETSDDRLNGDMAENFTVRTDLFSPPANLTVSATADRADQDGDGLAEVNSVDSPGFINSFGEDTGGTNAFGGYKLTNLPTNFQEGRAFVVIATADGFSTDYVDAFVQESGAETDIRTTRNFNLEPEEIEPDNVNITQVGTHPPLSETDGQPDPSEITEFENQSDRGDHPVPRDGRTIDVVEIETTTELGSSINGSVIFEVLDNDSNGADDFEGEFLRVVNQSDDAILRQIDEDTVVVATGEDGTATLLIEADEKTSTFETEKVGTLTNDRAESDSANVTWVGVTTFQSASISGIVTDTDDTPIPGTAVYVTQFTYGAETDDGVLENRVTLEPKDNDDDGTRGDADDVNEPDDEFEIRLQNYNEISNRYETVRGPVTVEVQDLRDYEFPEQDFPGISITATDGYKLFVEAADPIDASYTLDPVPAVDRNVSRTFYEVRGVKLNQPFRSRTGNAEVAQGLIPNFTGTANIVIPIEVVEDRFVIRRIDANIDATPGETSSVFATFRNTGQTTGQQEVVLSADLNRDGVFETELDSRSVALDANGTDRVQFNAEFPEDVAFGEYNIRANTDDGSRTATINVTEADSTPGPGDGIEDAQDLDGDGLFEDVDGNGAFDLRDVRALLRNADDISSSNTDFDFSGDGTFDLRDVRALLGSA